jgi:hypothetical protein
MAGIIHDLSKKTLASYYNGRPVSVTGSNGFAVSYLIPILSRIF